MSVRDATDKDAKDKVCLLGSQTNLLSVIQVEILLDDQSLDYGPGTKRKNNRKGSFLLVVGGE